MAKEYRYNEIDLNILEKYREENFGNFDNVFHEIVSDELHIDIYVSDPTEDRDYYILMTEGMGAYKMKVADGLNDNSLGRAELMLYLPSDWKMDFDDENNYWPLRFLKILARFPLNNDTWLGFYHSLGNGGESFSDNNTFKNLFLLPFVDMKTGEVEHKSTMLSCGDTLNIFTVIPIYDEELLYKKEYGGYQLLKEMRAEHKLEDFLITNPGRKNTFKVNRFSDFDKYSDTRLELENPEQIVKFEDKGFEKAIRKLFALEGEIRHKDIGYIERLEFCESIITGGGYVDIHLIELEEKIKSLKDLRWFTNLLYLGMDYGDPGYPYIFGDLKDVLCLERLRSLDLSGSIINGDLEELKKLPKLTEIILTGKGISGNLSSLKDFTDLECLYICDTMAKGDIKELANLKNLNELTISYSLFEGDIKVFKNMPKLEIVDLNDSKVEGDISVFANLDNLEKVSANDTSVYGDIKAFVNKKKLELLELESSDVSGDIKDIISCTRMKGLNIADTSITGESEELLAFKNIIDLSFAGSDLNVNPEVISALSDDDVNCDIVEEEFQDEDDEDFYNDMTILYKNSGEGIEFFEIYEVDEELGIIHYGTVGEMGTTEEIYLSEMSESEWILEKKGEGFEDYEELEKMFEANISTKDYPRVDPYSLARNIDDVLAAYGLGYIAKSDVKDGFLTLDCDFVDFDMAKAIIKREFEELYLIIK